MLPDQGDHECRYCKQSPPPPPPPPPPAAAASSSAAAAATGASSSLAGAVVSASQPQRPAPRWDSPADLAAVQRALPPGWIAQVGQVGRWSPHARARGRRAVALERDASAHKKGLWAPSRTPWSDLQVTIFIIWLNTVES